MSCCCYLLPDKFKKDPNYESILEKDPFISSVAKELHDLALIKELLEFQIDLNREKYIYLPHESGRYLGKHDPRQKFNENKTHGGLLSSRIFTGVEIILIILIANQLIEFNCISISIESDGILVLAPKDAPLDDMNTSFCRKISQNLINQDIPLSITRFEEEAPDYGDLPLSIKEYIKTIEGRLKQS